MASEVDEHIELLPEISIDQRILGKYEGRKPGPNIVFFGGIHGNEPAGIHALKNVADSLNQLNPDFKGTFIALAGNMQALEQNQRFLGKDLNRIWFPNTLIPKNERSIIPEYQEKIGILNELIRIVDNGKPTILFDLHTTSSHSMPFISISDTLKNRKIIRNIPVNLVLGLEELLDGPMFSFFSEIGLPAVLFEAGQHKAISSYENHVAFIWMMLAELKAIRKRSIPKYNRYAETLKKNVPGGNKTYEIKYRHLINEQEAFRMKDGFVNFQKVEKGQTIAYNHEGKIMAKRSGFIFMPLYQPQGCDGFFIVNQIKPFWFKASSRTRKLRLDKALRWLPGVSQGNLITDGYVIDKQVARYKVISLLHLLGYRKVKEKGEKINMTRRPYDTKFPMANKVKENLAAYLQLLKS